jgi:integrase/recombinase XerD
LGREQIRTYQLYLAQEKKLYASALIVADSALRFLYNVTLHREWNLDDVIPAPKMPQKLPIILSPEEVLEFLGCVRLHNHRTILTCCYASGLRISQALALQAAHMDTTDGDSRGASCFRKNRFSAIVRDRNTTVNKGMGLETRPEQIQREL